MAGAGAELFGEPFGDVPPRDVEQRPAELAERPTCSGSRWLLTSTTRSSPAQISVTIERSVSSLIEIAPGKSAP